MIGNKDCTVWDQEICTFEDVALIKVIELSVGRVGGAGGPRKSTSTLVEGELHTTLLHATRVME